MNVCLYFSIKPKVMCYCNLYCYLLLIYIYIYIAYMYTYYIYIIIYIYDSILLRVIKDCVVFNNKLSASFSLHLVSALITKKKKLKNKQKEQIKQKQFKLFFVII